MDNVQKILNELRANQIWKCAICLTTGTYGDEKPADDWGPPSSHVCEETDDPEEKIKRYVRTELNAQYKEYIKSLPWWCTLCGDGGNYVGDIPYYWLPPSDHVCKEREPTPRENATSTLQRLIKKLDEIPKTQTIGVVKQVVKTDQELVVVWEPTEKGLQNLKKAQKIMDDLFSNIPSLRYDYSRDFDDHERY